MEKKQIILFDARNAKNKNVRTYFPCFASSEFPERQFYASLQGRGKIRTQLAPQRREPPHETGSPWPLTPDPS